MTNADKDGKHKEPCVLWTGFTTLTGENDAEAQQGESRAAGIHSTDKHACFPHTWL